MPSASEAVTGPGVAVIVGSSFHRDVPKGLKLRRRRFQTDFGEYTLYQVVSMPQDSSESKQSQVSRPAYIVFRHGLPHRLLPHQVNYRAMAAALKMAGVGSVLITSSVGVMDPSLPLFKPMLVSDYCMLANFLPDGSPPTMWIDPHPEHGHLVFSASKTFSTGLADQLQSMASEGLFQLHPQEVTFAYCSGPRTKTPFETALYRETLRVQTNSMTLAPEAVLLSELEISTVGVVIGHVGTSTVKTGSGKVGAIADKTKTEKWNADKVTESLTASSEAIIRLIVAFLRSAVPVDFAHHVYRFETAELSAEMKACMVDDDEDEDWLISKEKKSELYDFMRRKDWLPSSVTGLVSVCSAGDGNMNITLRVCFETKETKETKESSSSSLIVKQSPPFVAKYPSVAAPSARAAVEHRFTSLVADTPAIHRYFPEIHAFDAERNVICMEDLGSNAEDLTFLYRWRHRVSLSSEVIHEAAIFLRTLHDTFPAHTDAVTSHSKHARNNEAMRTLNAAHIFQIPLLADTGGMLDLDTITPGFAEVANTYRADAELSAAIHQLEPFYLCPDTKASNSALLHGDFFPGSIMLDQSNQLRIIDTEFSFVGAREFDIGVFLAHLHLCAQPEEVRSAFKKSYGVSECCDATLLAQFTGVEIIRRLIGVAQLPLHGVTLKEKCALLAEARSLLVR